MADEPPALELRGITKRFPGVLANDHVDFDLRRREVHALLGENGAGKSTLMSILYGLYHPDEGEVIVDGRPVAIDSPRRAIDLGIGMVHQHFMLVPVMTVAENIVLADEPRGRGGLVDAITGLRRPERGQVLVGGRDLTPAGARGMVDAGVSHIAEDRHRRGLVLDFTLAENLALREYRTRKLSRLGWLSTRRMAARARSLIREFDVRGGAPDTLAGALSGGNQQKVVIAREIACNPRVLVAAQPTRGLDVGAIEFVHRRLVAERDAGRGILLMSLESEEVRSLADRILVIYEGRIVGEFPPDATEEELGIAMTGGRRRDAAACRAALPPR